jgi:Na+/melibiose symporter-like transporter
LINAIDIPARQSFVVQMIENRDDLSNGIALNSSMVHGSRIIGPAIAGILIYKIGEGCCFLLDGLSYLAVIAALLAMHVKPRARPLVHRHPLHDFKEGLRYAFGSPPIRTLLLLIAIVSLLGMSQSTLMPIMANRILNGHARTFGMLLCASGCGAFVGSIYLAGRVATQLGAPRTLRLSGLGCLIAGLIYLTRLRALRPLVHGIYIKKGILPEVAAAMQATEPLPSSPPEG